MLHLAVTGVLADETPKGLTLCCAVLSGLDQGPWWDTAHRTSIFPYLRRLASCARDEAADPRRAFRLADHARGALAPDFLDAIGKSRTAVQLRALPVVADR